MYAYLDASVQTEDLPTAKVAMEVADLNLIRKIHALTVIGGIVCMLT